LQAITSIVVLCSSCKAFAQNEYPADLLPAAKAEVVRFLESRPRACLERDKYIAVNDRISDCSLGEPYPRYKLERDRLLMLGSSDSFKTCLTFLSWNIPVYFNNEPRTLVDMYNADGVWRFGAIGQDPAPFLEARALWPAADGYRISYIIDTQGLDYFMIERGKDIGLYSYREETEGILGIRKDAAGQFPLLSVPYVVQKLKAER